MATEVTLILRLEFDDPNLDELMDDIERIDYVSAVELADVQEV